MNKPKISRIELIDQQGRVYTNRGVCFVSLDFQDDGRTLKIFFCDKEK